MGADAEPVAATDAAAGAERNVEDSVVVSLYGAV